MTINQSYWRFRWHGLILAWCLSIVGWIVVAMQADRYEATAQIYIDANSSLEQFRNRLAGGNRHFTVLDLIQETSLDNRRLEEVIRAAGPLDKSATAGDRKKAVDNLLDRIGIGTSARWENLFGISYSDTDRRNALAVIEAFVAAIAKDAMDNTDAEKNDENSVPDTTTAPQFRIIEPPAVGSSPVSSIRSVLVLSVLIASLGAGACLAYWLNFRTPVFNNSEDISAIGELAVVGVVTHAWMVQAKAQHRHELIIFVSGATVLLLCFALVLLV